MYCECGCGQKTRVAPYSARSIGWEKGKPIKFIHGHQRRKTTPPYIVDENGCWIWQRYRNQKGYGMMRDGSPSMRYSHRVYYERAKGVVPKEMQLDHLCRNRACVNPDHLEPVTNTENARRGKRAKLTLEQVRDIRGRPRTYGSTLALAREFDVHPGSISRIRNQVDQVWIDPATPESG